MAQQIFVNLPVKDLKASIEFFTKLGYTFNAQFTDETATCMVVSDTIFFMLLRHEKFASFSPAPICDTSKSLEMLLCLSCESREAVNILVDKAVAAGGSVYRDPMGMGFMYGHGFRDLDGHVWEVMWMDPSAVNPQ